MQKLVRAVHGRLVHRRRVGVIADVLAPWLPEAGLVVDVGSGDGAVGAEILKRRPGLRIEGYDVVVRDGAAISVHQFDGHRLPLPDRSAEAVLLVDVLHHCDSPGAMLQEALRVARCLVLIKDHRLGHPAARALLAAMDWVGNRPHGVVLPFNYWDEERWRETWDQLGLSLSRYEPHLGIYPFPFSLVLDSGLHFAAALERRPT